LLIYEALQAGIHQLNLELPDKYAMEHGVWVTNSILKNIYQHTMSDARFETESKLNDFFSSIVG
jgi:hypothetical protein